MIMSKTKIDNDLVEIKNYIVKRLSCRPDKTRSLKVDTSTAVSQIIDADEEFLDWAEEEYFYSNDDEIEYIRKKTRFSWRFIDFVLWLRMCYEMEQGRWQYADKGCMNCGGGPLLIKEIPGVDFAEKVVCQKCGCEMVFGDNGLERFRG